MRKSAQPIVVVDHRLTDSEGRPVEGLTSGVPAHHILDIKLLGTGRWEYSIALKGESTRLQYDDGQEDGAALLRGVSKVDGNPSSHKKRVTYDAQQRTSPEDVRVQVAAFSRNYGFSGAFDPLNHGPLFVPCSP